MLRLINQLYNLHRTLNLIILLTRFSNWRRNESLHIKLKQSPFILIDEIPDEQITKRSFITCQCCNCWMQGLKWSVSLFVTIICRHRTLEKFYVFICEEVYGRLIMPADNVTEAFPKACYKMCYR